jgi:hypothetical protein
MVSKLDAFLRILFVIALFIWVLLYGSAFETPYSKVLVELHGVPWWRFTIALLVIFASIWCPRVGLMAALGVFFYFSDLEKLTTPFVNLST